MFKHLSPGRAEEVLRARLGAPINPVPKGRKAGEDNDKVLGFELPRSGVLALDRKNNGAHIWLESHEIPNIEGVRKKPRSAKNANLNGRLAGLGNGQGAQVEIESEASLIELLNWCAPAADPLASLGVQPADDVDEATDKDPRTMTEAWRAARLGQSKFRSDLLKRWNSKCAVIGLDMPELLRASHIKPWCDSSDRERLDPDNGLLLAVHIDVLFDGGLISFADDGKMLASTTLSHATRQALGVDRALSINGLSEGNRRYLAMHRDEHFPAGGALRAHSVE